MCKNLFNSCIMHYQKCHWRWSLWIKEVDELEQEIQEAERSCFNPFMLSSYFSIDIICGYGNAVWTHCQLLTRTGKWKGATGVGLVLKLLKMTSLEKIKFERLFQNSWFSNKLLTAHCSTWPELVRLYFPFTYQSWIYFPRKQKILIQKSFFTYDVK